MTVDIRRRKELDAEATNPYAFDTLNRAQAVDNFCAVLSKAKTPLVIGLEGAWGSGKTVFARLAQHKLRQDAFPVVFFNAWECDFMDDPLLPLLSEVEQQLGTADDNPDQARRWKSIKAISILVAKRALPIALSAATGGVLGSEAVKAVVGDQSGRSDQIAAGISDAGADVFQALKKSKDNNKALFDAFAAIIKDIREKNGGKTVIIFVDELDRCRPSFAIAALERIKHLFSVEGVVFVLSVDADQLAAAISGVYGDKYNGKGYLRRFIDYNFALPKIEAKAYVEQLFKEFNIPSFFARRTEAGSELRALVSTIGDLSQLFGLSLRDVEQVVLQLNVALSIITNRLLIFPAFLGTLIVLRYVDRSLLDEYIQGAKSARELLGELRSHPGGRAFFSKRESAQIEAYLAYYAARKEDFAELIKEYQNSIKGGSLEPEIHKRAELIVKSAEYIGAGQYGVPLDREETRGFLFDVIDAAGNYKS